MPKPCQEGEEEARAGTGAGPGGGRGEGGADLLSGLQPHLEKSLFYTLLP